MPFSPHPCTPAAQLKMDEVLSILGSAAQRYKFRSLANPWIKTAVHIALIDSVITVHYNPGLVAALGDFELGQAVLRELHETRERYRQHAASRPGRLVQ